MKKENYNPTNLQSFHNLHIKAAFKQKNYHLLLAFCRRKIRLPTQIVMSLSVGIVSDYVLQLNIIRDQTELIVYGAINITYSACVYVSLP